MKTREWYNTTVGTDFSDKQLNFAYWWLTHRDAIARFGVRALIGIAAGIWLLSIVLWVRFVWFEPGTRRAFQQVTQPLVDVRGFWERHPITELVVETPVVIAMEAPGRDRTQREDRALVVENVNAEWAAHVQYQFADDGRAFTAVVLPNERKLLVELGATRGSGALFEQPVPDVRWQRVHDYTTRADQLLRLRIHDRETGDATSPIFIPVGTNDLPVSRVTFTVTNESAATFAHPSFLVSLWEGETLVGVNRVTIDALRPQETRIVDASWTEVFASGIAPGVRVQIDPDVNILDPEEFL